MEGRLGLGTQDTHNCPQQVCLPVEFEAQRVVCGVDCSMIISTQHSIMASGSNRYPENPKVRPLVSVNMMGKVPEEGFVDVFSSSVFLHWSKAVLGVVVG